MHPICTAALAGETDAALIKHFGGSPREPLTPTMRQLATQAAISLLDAGSPLAALRLFRLGHTDEGVRRRLCQLAMQSAQAGDAALLRDAIASYCLLTGQIKLPLCSATNALEDENREVLPTLIARACWEGIESWLCWQPQAAQQLDWQIALPAAAAAFQAGHALAAIGLAGVHLPQWLGDAETGKGLHARLQEQLRSALNQEDVLAVCVLSHELRRWGGSEAGLADESWRLIDRLGSVEQARLLLGTIAIDETRLPVARAAAEKLLQRYIRRSRWLEVEQLLGGAVLSDVQRYKLRKQYLSRLLELREIDLAAPLLQSLNTHDPEQRFFALWLVALRGELSEAEALFAQLSADDPVWYRAARLLYEFHNARRDFAASCRYGRILLDRRSAPEPSRMLHIAQMASYVWGEEALMAEAIKAGFDAAEALEAAGISDEPGWDALLNFHLRTFAFDKAWTLLLQVKALKRFDVSDDEALLMDIQQTFAPVKWALDEAAAAVRTLATGDTSLMRAARQPEECAFHLYSGMFAARVEFEEVRHYQRKTFSLVLQALLAKGIRPVIVPQFALNEQVVLPGTHLSVSYHTIDSRPNCIHIKEADLPHLMNIDPYGYAGWSSLALRPKEWIDAELEKISDEEANAFFEAEHARIVGGNLSKYRQPEQDASWQPPKPYVFLALQTRWDKVQELAYVDMLDMLRIVVNRFEDTGINVVIKRHPACQDHGVANTLRELAMRSHVQISTASVHTLMAHAEAVMIANSGVGAEALAHMKPVYLFGRAEYQYACHTVRTAQEFAEKTACLALPLPAQNLRRFYCFYKAKTLQDISRQSVDLTCCM
ncbi:MAG: hypothetical protein Q7J29_05485 [Stagnimonas sp.]|nr:hypothetical protein [Stagnimonas sp.]